MFANRPTDDTVPVILYHDVEAVPKSGLGRWTVSPEQFRQHLDVIAASGRTPLTISQVAACLRGERRVEGPLLAVTFDDGYASTRRCVLELLERGLGATVYITTGTIDTPGMIAGDDLAAMSSLDGVEIGAHTVSHPHVDEIAGPALEDEIAGSKQMLETLLGESVTSFAYPHGSHDRRSRDAVIRAGYRSGAAIKNAISHLKDDPYAIARWTVTADTSPERLAQVLRGESVPLAWRRERLRTRASRTVRRARRRMKDRPGADPATGVDAEY
jgi:peptidoglycan/xylan/chitin deacetylase (PgdA/CDA1 family)